MSEILHSQTYRIDDVSISIMYDEDEVLDPETTHLIIYDSEDKPIMTFISPDVIYDFVATVKDEDPIFVDLHKVVTFAFEKEWL